MVNQNNMVKELRHDKRHSCESGFGLRDGTLLISSKLSACIKKVFIDSAGYCL